MKKMCCKYEAIYCVDVIQFNVWKVYTSFYREADDVVLSGFNVAVYTLNYNEGL